MKLFSDNDVTVGKVLSPHGVGGMVKVFPLSDFPERASRLEKAEIVSEGSRRRIELESASLYGRFWLVKFAGIDTREEVQLLTGSYLVIPKEERFVLPDDAFYHDQLVGLEIYTTEGAFLGLLVEVISTGGHDMYLLQRVGTGEKIMIPAVKKVVRTVDLKAGRIVVELPAGLLDL